MHQSLVFAKKLLLDSKAANVLQSVNMALAFAEAGADLRFYPGTPDAAATEALLRTLGIKKTALPAWHYISTTHKGLYGALFRYHLACDVLVRRNAIFYTRDIKEAVFLIRMAQLAGCKLNLLFEMHEVLYKQHQQQGAKHNWQQTRRMEQIIMQHITGLVVINESLIEAARDEFGYTGKTLVEPSGVNLNLFSPIGLFTPEHPWPGQDEKVQLVYIGSMQKGKGVHELVDAMALLPTRFHLRVIGFGSADAVQEFETRRAAVPDGMVRVTCTGFVPQTEIKQLCEDAHIAVIPQQAGNAFFSPLKLYESLALGLPTVCTPLQTFATQSHLLHMAQSATPQGIAEAIAKLANSPELATSLSTAGTAAAEQMSWPKRARRIIAFGQTICTA